MQTSKYLVAAAGVIAWLAVSSALFAEDTPAQIKAREALRKQMSTPSEPATAAPKAPEKSAPPPAPKPAEPAKATPPPAAAAVAAPAATPAAKRDLFLPVPPPTTAAALIPASARADGMFLPVPPPSDVSKVSPALRAAYGVAGKTPMPGVAPVIVAPIPSAVSATKEGKLAEILQFYKTDQITAEQYHTQRAAIIAQP